MIKPFNFFIITKKAKKTMPSKETASALLLSSEKFLKLCEATPLNKELASPILVNAYEAAREAGQSVMAECGYKPYSHEAVISFLTENTKLNIALLDKFDNLRVLRNQVTYKAEKVEVIDAENAIELAKELIEKIKVLIASAHA